MAGLIVGYGCIAILNDLLDGFCAGSFADNPVVIQTPNAAIKGDAHNNFVWGRFTERIFDRIFHKVNACNGSCLTAFIVFVISHNQKMVSIFSKCRIIVGPMPTNLPVVRIGCNCDGNLLMGRDFFPQKPDKFRVLIPLFVGDIFNIHIYAI